MKLTKKSAYAFHMIGYLNENTPKSASANLVALRYNLSSGFMVGVVRQLKNAKILNSKKGPGGGYTLSQNINDITVGDVLKAVEEDISQDKAWNSEFCNTVVSSLNDNLQSFAKKEILNFHTEEVSFDL